MQLTYEYQLNADVIDHRSVIAHLRSVLNALANKPHYSEFYIGITNDLERRKKEHMEKGFKLMCPIYQEPANFVANSFHNLERDAINTFRNGIQHPTTGQVLLRCANTPGGSLAKNWLYVMVK